MSLACGDESSAPAPPPLGAERTNKAPDTKDDEPAPPEQDEVLTGAVVLPAPDPPSTFAGTLATTSTVKFGGGGFCNYDITLRDVVFEIDVQESGEIVRAAMRDLAVEKALDNCPYSAMDPSIQDFTLKTKTETTTGTHLELEGGKANRPKTSLAIDLVQAGAGYGATATWKRTDQTGALAWTVTAKVNLVRK